MRLTPQDMEKLMLHYAGKLAEERRARGPKAQYIRNGQWLILSMELMEMARDGHTVTDLMTRGREIPHA